MKLKLEIIERPGVFLAICTPMEAVILQGSGESRKDAERRCLLQAAKWIAYCLEDKEVGSSMGIKVASQFRDGLEVESVMLSEKPTKLELLNS